MQASVTPGSDLAARVDAIMAREPSAAREQERQKAPANATPRSPAQASSHVSDTPKTSQRNGAEGTSPAGTGASGTGAKGTSAKGTSAPDDGPAKTLFNEPTPGGAKRSVSQLLGEITWLLTQSKQHRQFFLSDLEWLVMTPILLQQFRVFYAKDRPAGVLFWAFVDEEGEQRLAEGTTKLRPQDWKSGDRLWVVEVIAPFGGAEEMVKDLKEKVFAEREIKFLTLSEQGKEVKTL
jgi:cytolysin-activating lysine-acyltransferase